MLTAYVEECRHEWKRLGVPDLLAEEMATELESDLAEAQADGVSATEILGESDPRRFAATWASERGLVAEPGPAPRRRRRWIWILVGLIALVLVAWIVTVIGLFAATSVSVHTSGKPPFPARTVAIPAGPVVVLDFVGMNTPHALALARNHGLRTEVRPVPGHRAGVVVAQTPTPGARVPRGSTVRLRVDRG